jgi:hypothetical protein
LILVFAAVAGSLVVFAMHDVPAAPTQEDARAISQLLPNEKRHPRAFEEEVALILRVQDRVLAVSPEERGIGLDQPRELQDLIRARHGACFDRSRAIETILRSYGFRTRHAAMYSTVETGSALRALATPDTISHALTEVQTSRGWMIVDSKTRWAGLTSEDRHWTFRRYARIHSGSGVRRCAMRYPKSMARPLPGCTDSTAATAVSTHPITRFPTSTGASWRRTYEPREMTFRKTLS